MTVERFVNFLVIAQSAPVPIAAAARPIDRVSIINFAVVGIAVVSGLLITKWQVHPVVLVLRTSIAGVLLF